MTDSDYSTRSVQPESPDPADLTLARRIEEASLNAWPALQQILLDGWILRFSKGFTKRANSIVPLYPAFESVSPSQLVAKIRYCENLYSREQLQTVFRLSSLLAATNRQSVVASADEPAPGLDQILFDRGYTFAEPSCVLSLPMEQQLPLQSERHSRHNKTWSWQLLPLERWLPIYCNLTDVGEPASTLHSLILQSISGTCGFAVLFSRGTDDEPANAIPIACGLGVVQGDLLGLFDIYTHPGHRNLGAGRAIVDGLLQWAKTAGAQTAYLQMAADNDSAATLYQQIGFREVYRYWYRISV